MELRKFHAYPLLLVLFYRDLYDRGAFFICGILPASGASGK
jgi:hypothetical protein